MNIQFFFSRQSLLILLLGGSALLTPSEMRAADDEQKDGSAVAGSCPEAGELNFAEFCTQKWGKVSEKTLATDILTMPAAHAARIEGALNIATPTSYGAGVLRELEELRLLKSAAPLPTPHSAAAASLPSPQAVDKGAAKAAEIAPSTVVAPPLSTPVIDASTSAAAIAPSVSTPTEDVSMNAAAASASATPSPEVQSASPRSKEEQIEDLNTQREKIVNTLLLTDDIINRNKQRIKSLREDLEKLNNIPDKVSKNFTVTFKTREMTGQQRELVKFDSDSRDKMKEIILKDLADSKKNLKDKEERYKKVYDRLDKIDEQLQLDVLDTSDD